VTYVPGVALLSSALRNVSLVLRNVSLVLRNVSLVLRTYVPGVALLPHSSPPACPARRRRQGGRLPRTAPVHSTKGWHCAGQCVVGWRQHYDGWVRRGHLGLQRHREVHRRPKQLDMPRACARCQVYSPAAPRSPPCRNAWHATSRAAHLAVAGPAGGIISPRPKLDPGAAGGWMP
jgi:hypothetical protein